MSQRPDLVLKSSANILGVACGRPCYAAQLAAAVDKLSLTLALFNRDLSITFTCTEAGHACLKTSKYLF